jgi:hypothetical protein
MRVDTIRHDRPPQAVRFALWLLWCALGISVAGYLISLFRPAATSTSGMPLPLLYLQIVVAVVIYGFLATINSALARRRNWARGSLFGMVLLESVIVLLAFLVLGKQSGGIDLVSTRDFAFYCFAYALRVAGLVLVMIPGRHWYRMP